MNRHSHLRVVASQARAPRGDNPRDPEGFRSGVNSDLDIPTMLFLTSVAGACVWLACGLAVAAVFGAGR